MSGDESDYREQEHKTGHILEGDEEQAGEEEFYDEDGDQEIPLDKMKEIIIALQVALKERDVALLQSKKQNIELLTELEQLSEQYIREQTNEADQLKRVKQYEEEFAEIQKGTYLINEAMTAKLSQIGNVQEKLDSLNQEKEELGKALVESTQINKQLKDLLSEKDGIISKLQGELEKFLNIKNELTPILKESTEMKNILAAKDAEIANLTTSLEEATKIVAQLPNIEAYVKQAAGAIKEMGEENRTLKAEVGVHDQLNEVTLEKETMKAAHEELQNTVSNFVEKDAEIKKLFDMFEKTLKAVSEENSELKEKFDGLMKENEGLKGMVIEYQKDLGDAKEQLVQASKYMDEYQQLKKAQIQQRTTNYSESSMGRKSEPVHVEERPSYQKAKNSKSHRGAHASHDHGLGDIERIDEEEDHESSHSIQSKPKPRGKTSSERESVLRNSTDLAYLRESNKLLKRQNETLKIQTKLIEEKTKLEKDEYGKVAVNYKLIVENLAKALKDIRSQATLKLATSDSEEDAYKFEAKKSKKRVKKKEQHRKSSEEKVSKHNSRA